MMTRAMIAAAMALAASAYGSTLSELGPDLARARASFGSSGELIWKGYGEAPSGMLLVTPEGETLLCQDDPPASFTMRGRDPATGCAVSVRARSGLPDYLLAAMPVFGSKSTIVMGTPETTGQSRVDWVRTILHEHFHQWQTSRPGYSARVDRLDLKGGDETGMWMLNFPFPYADAAVSDAYSRASAALADALSARGSGRFLAAFDRYLAARTRFSRAAGARNWRYLEFELWQEGGARWTEFAIAKASGDAAGKAAAIAGERQTVARLRKPDLKAQGRELVYVLGTAELMLVDECGPAWRASYPNATSLEPLLRSARRRCAFGR